MFVSIDMDKLVFLHKHHDQETLSGLSWLEAPDRSIKVVSTDPYSFLTNFSRLDLCMLYKNTTGAELVVAQSAVLRQQLREAVEAMPAKLALLAEVTAQIATVEADLYDGIAYSYVIGSKVPGKAQELFPLKAKPLAMQELEAAAQRAVSAPAAPTPVPVVATPSATPAKAPTAPRAGSVRPVVWAAADKAWEAIGKSQDPVALSTLRTAVLAEMIAAGYHQTTVRIKLSEWGKERLK